MRRISTLLLLVFLELFALNYEIVVFNEELFIALGFASFFLFVAPIFPGFVGDFLTEDRNRLYGLLVEDISANGTFFRHFFEFVHQLESLREFVHQNLNFLVFFALRRFAQFYGRFAEIGTVPQLEGRLPESVFLFFDRMVSVLVGGLRSKYLDYFQTKWNSSLRNIAAAEYFSTERDADATASGIFWIYG